MSGYAPQASGQASIRPSNPTMEQLNGLYGQMNLNPQIRDRTAAAAPRNGNAAARNEAVFEAWGFRKTEGMSGKPRWGLCTRKQIPMDSITAKSLIQSKKKTAEQQLNKDDMQVNKKKQVTQLVKDRNLFERDRLYEWVLRDITLERDATQKNAFKSMQVILQRKSVEKPREGLLPNQGFEWRSVINVDNVDPQHLNVHNTFPGHAAYGMQAQSEGNGTWPNARSTQPQQSWQNPSPSQQRPPVPPNISRQQSFYQAASAGQGKAPTPNHPPSDPRNTKYYANEHRVMEPAVRGEAKYNTQKRRSSSGKRSPDIVQIHTDSEGSSSASEVDSDSDNSDSGTAATEFSYETRGSPKGRSLHKGSSSHKPAKPERQEHNSRKHSHKSTYIRQHERPRAKYHDESSSGDESQSSSENADVLLNRTSGRHRKESYRRESSHRHKRSEQAPYIRHHDRPVPREISPVSSNGRYSFGSAEIQPSRGSGIRRGSMHSRTSSYEQYRPTLDRRSSVSYDRRQSFGSFDGRPSIGMELGRRAIEHEHPYYDREQARFIDLKTKRLQEWEEELEDKEFQHKVDSAVHRTMTERESRAGYTPRIRY